MLDIRKAERALERWLDQQTMLWALAAVHVADNCLPAFGSLRGRLVLLPEQEALILRSEVGSFLNIESWASARHLDVKTDWQGTMIEVRTSHEILLVADYEPPSEFFDVDESNARPRAKGADRTSCNLQKSSGSRRTARR
ncbi:MAG: hypothetical protein JO093_05665 [Acidobacteria bacterium]|nr:hypothetical protein [Acidobacteriota bacterium]MBV9068064.1 hypothetical protein [Acidobacteriota bacterium]MBV9185085.1 hypothetical protein [Acidobacteriota bacterium]